MDSQPLVKPMKAEPLKLHGDNTDDWVSPFGCEHVVVNFSPEKTSRKKKTKKKAKKGGKEIEDELQSFCVLCGETVSDNENMLQANKNDEMKSPMQETQKDVKLINSVVDKRQTLFSSARKLSSSVSSLSQSSAAHVYDTRACLIHAHKKIKYFCEDHQEVCCSVCVNVLHRGCERVMFIKDELNNGWDPKTCEHTMKALVYIAESFAKIIEQNQQAHKELQDEMEAFKHRREQFRKKVIHLLDEYDNTSDKMVKKFIKLSERDINSTIETCKEAMREAEASREMLEYTLNSATAKESFIATQKVLKQKNKYGFALSEAVKKSKIRAIEFVQDSAFENIESLKRIAEVQFSAESVMFPEGVISSVSKLPKHEIRSPRDVLGVFARSDTTSSLENTLTFVGKFSVRLADDKGQCENVAAAFLADDRVAVVDMKNKKLKVFDSKFSKAYSVELSSEPRGVAVVSPHEVAVSLPDESKIQFVTTHKKLSAIRSILTSLPCYGITCFNQELIVLCDDGFSTTAIQVLDLDGKVIKTLKMNKSGHVILKNPWNLAVNLDGQHVCVTDRGRLVCVDMKGARVFQYLNDSLENARGLTVDNLGRYYVCGTGSSNVHQVSHDGKLLGVVLTEKDVPQPQAVCYQQSKRLLLLTAVGNDNIYLYKLPK
ncbi:uncharacterized protein LOC127846431 [Dreissena polymorpha]|uniref:Uncharacterized protein n=1 Tax=Dreissena polymorpha TaxID=45954 RepID=A0A9D4III5_DREPO|nr:uncharacterized protein LOC127846431 [Dreissena polymorpha]XP_052233631.1 uncharacterized protein LOC127846431 [Dreissena polymorpha]XP_052233632.1 uncharacterized protein LOC127846431 [Dreissena polymorpha]XP_052233633.1 uncharacterized protein LOC127846431 [Dreissena polymorpha]KAH3774349.1 hypothetical protein DPMN_175729 [Dreissena polymorpha]